MDSGTKQFIWTLFGRAKMYGFVNRKKKKRTLPAQQIFVVAYHSSKGQIVQNHTKSEHFLTHHFKW